MVEVKNPYNKFAGSWGDLGQRARERGGERFKKASS